MRRLEDIHSRALLLFFVWCIDFRSRKISSSSVLSEIKLSVLLNPVKSEQRRMRFDLISAWVDLATKESKSGVVLRNSFSENVERKGR
jgi:hypothetical protein